VLAFTTILIHFGGSRDHFCACKDAKNDSTCSQLRTRRVQRVSRFSSRTSRCVPHPFGEKSASLTPLAFKPETLEQSHVLPLVLLEFYFVIRASSLVQYAPPTCSARSVSRNTRVHTRTHTHTHTQWAYESLEYVYVCARVYVYNDGVRQRVIEHREDVGRCVKRSVLLTCTFFL